MKSLLEDMYYHNITLKNDSRAKHKTEAELVERLTVHEQKLGQLLNDVGKERLEKLVDCQGELLTFSSCEAFRSGFRLGGRIVMEILVGESDMELQDSFTKNVG